MASLLSFDSPSFSPAVFEGAHLAFGVFDGVHKGHQYLIQAAREFKKSPDEKLIILTFDKDPDELFGQADFRKIMSNNLRLQTLQDSGVDLCVVLPFTPEFASLKPFDFLQNCFARSVPASIHTGLDLRFGKRAQGSIKDLCAYFADTACHVVGHELFVLDGAPVSSSRIRKLLAQPELGEAEYLLGHPYKVRGVVEAGRGDGARFGFATANLYVPETERVLADGVYGGRVSYQGKTYKAAVSVGIPPCFENSHANIEVHILDFSGDLYSQEIELEFVLYLRPMQKFDRLDKLIAQVKHDIEVCRREL